MNKVIWKRTGCFGPECNCISWLAVVARCWLDKVAISYHNKQYRPYYINSINAICYAVQLFISLTSVELYFYILATVVTFTLFCLVTEPMSACDPHGGKLSVFVSHSRTRCQLVRLRPWFWTSSEALGGWFALATSLRSLCKFYSSCILVGQFPHSCQYDHQSTLNLLTCPLLDKKSPEVLFFQRS